MTRADAPSAPADTDLLCEGCGYTLNGLPASSVCPECGKPIAESVGHHRGASPFERATGVGAFVATTAYVLFRPTWFYRTLAARRSSREARWFANIHMGIASVLFAHAATTHFTWFLEMNATPLRTDHPLRWMLLPLLTVATWALLEVTTRLASRLTTWEAHYRGIRLPLPVVRRSLHYHAAHYLPVALIAATTVLGYHYLTEYQYLEPYTTANMYLYVLSGEVIVAAAYLFNTYWIGMRNMMFANK